MNLVAWSPDLLVSPDLTSVRVRPGQVSEDYWIQALSNRVQQLVKKEENPQEALQKACQQLKLVSEPKVSQAGQTLVEKNLQLRTYLQCSNLDKSPFPAQVKESDPEAQQSLDEVSLEDWVYLAALLMSESDLL